jgi:hypothetical protein
LTLIRKNCPPQQPASYGMRWLLPILALQNKIAAHSPAPPI